MSVGYVISFLYLIYKGTGSFIYHISVGFCVVRSGRIGNAKASKCGTNSEYRLPRFFFLYDNFDNKTI